MAFAGGVMAQARATDAMIGLTTAPFIDRLINAAAAARRIRW